MVTICRICENGRSARVDGLLRVTFEIPFLVAAGASLLLAAYVLAVGRASILWVQMLGVAGGALVWSIWFGLLGAQPGPDMLVGTVLAKLLLLFSWFALVERLLRGPYLQSMPELVRRGVRWAWFLVVAAMIAVMLISSTYELAIPVAKMLSFGLLVLSLLGLVLSGPG